MDKIKFNGLSEINKVNCILELNKKNSLNEISTLLGIKKVLLSLLWKNIITLSMEKTF